MNIIILPLDGVGEFARTDRERIVYLDAVWCVLTDNS
jgi:hypothetical protein